MSLESALTITELIEGSKAFESTGYTEITITREGVPATTRLPIRSVGVAEMMEQMEAAAPLPPAVNRLVYASSDMGQKLGLEKDAPMITYDMTDPGYVKALGEHVNDIAWRVAVAGLAIEWKRKDGTLVESFKERKVILQKAGITRDQFDKIYEDITVLTKTAQGKADFLSGASSD